MKKIIILDFRTCTATIKLLPNELENAQIEEIEEYFDLNNDCQFMYGDIAINDETI